MFGAEGWVDGGAGCEDPGDFAANDGPGELGVFHLLAEGDAIALAQKALQVDFRGVVWDAAHGLLLLFIAGGEGELKLAGDEDGVVVEELVEVADAAEHEAVGILLLSREVLPHDGREHGCICAGQIVDCVSRQVRVSNSLQNLRISQTMEWTHKSPIQRRTRDRMIEIPLSPEQFKSKAAQIAVQQGISLAGHEGTIEKMGVKAAWVYENETLKITILDKPFFMSEAMVEEQLKRLL